MLCSVPFAEVHILIGFVWELHDISSHLVHKLYMLFMFYLEFTRTSHLFHYLKVISRVLPLYEVVSLLLHVLLIVFDFICTLGFNCLQL